MSALHRDTALFTRILGGLAQAAGEFAATASRMYKARQARSVTRNLLTHDDWLLADIGISRSDIEQALSVGWDEDPAQALAEIRRRRIQADRQGLIRRRAL